MGIVAAFDSSLHANKQEARRLREQMGSADTHEMRVINSIVVFIQREARTARSRLAK